MTAGAQVATKFQIKAIYGKGDVVYYPTTDVFWIAKSAFTAKTYPVEGTLWTRFYYPGPVANTTSTVSRSSFDSLLLRLDSVSTRIKKLEALPTPKAVEPSSTVKISRWGAALVKPINDTTLVIPSFIPSNDIDFVITDSTIQPILKKH